MTQIVYIEHIVIFVFKTGISIHNLWLNLDYYTYDILDSNKIISNPTYSSKTHIKHSLMFVTKVERLFICALGRH